MLAKGQVVPFVVLIGFFVMVIAMWRYSKRGWRPSVRSIAGLDAIEECVGRAAEMGKPVVCNMGRSTFDSQGIAAMNVMAYTTTLAVKKGADVIIPVAYAETIPTVEELARAAFIAGGSPEGFSREKHMRFLGSDSWAYCVGVQNILESRKPGAHIFVGQAGGEALIQAETGVRVGAVQVGGTTNTLQIPFYVAACDYALIGEEVISAGIYLSRDPGAIAQLRVMDLFKIVAIVLSIIGVLLASAGNLGLPNLLAS
jgi:hypothetical protein